MANIKKSPLAPEFCNSLQGIDPEDLHAWNTEIFSQVTSNKRQASKVTSYKQQAVQASSYKRQAKII
jgi:hypothetical protein